MNGPLVPWIQCIAETLKRIRKKKSASKVTLPNGETLVVTSKSFLCFTSSPLSIGRHELPSNMEVFLRPIALVNIDRVSILQILLKASGISSKGIVSSIVQQAETCETLLSTMRKLGRCKQIWITLSLHFLSARMKSFRKRYVKAKVYF